MKLAYCITVFNGWELLRPAIDNITPLVDEVIICYQKLSNTGNFEPLNYERSKMFTNDATIITWEPDLSKNTKQNERDKHQCMINRAKLVGCTHFIMGATDHFYEPEQFKKAVEKGKDYDVTVSKMYTYYKDPTWQITPIENYYMPFIHKLYAKTVVSPQHYPVLVDPSVQVNTHDQFYEFHQDDLMLHHYSMIRDNIGDKFNNAAASVNWSEDQKKAFKDEWENYDIQENKGVQYFRGNKIKVVPNYFNI